MYASTSLYSFSSSEYNHQTRECRSADRECMRCLMYDWEEQADGTGSYLAKNKFTKSFSPTDSLEDIFCAGECDGETRVLFCKPLNITSDEDEDTKGIKRTYEDTRDVKYFESKKKHCRGEIDQKSRRSSNASLPSSRAFKSSSVLSGITIIPSRRFNKISMRSSPSRSEGSTKSQSILKNIKNLEKSIRPKDGNEAVTVYKKTVITMTSSDNYIMGKPSKRLKEYSNVNGLKNDSRDSRNTATKVVSSQDSRNTVMKVVSQNMTVPVNQDSESKTRVRIPVIQRFLEELCEKSVPNPPSRVEIKVLPAIEEKTESQSSRSSKSKNVDSYSFTESLTSSGSELGSDHKQISSAVKTNFSGVRFKRKARLVIEKPGSSKMFPNSCLKKQSKLTSPVKSSSSKMIQKKSVKFLIDDDNEDETGSDLVRKKSARLEKYPDQLKVLQTSQKRKPSSSYVAAPVIVAIHETISTQLQNQRQDDTLNAVVKGQNVPKLVNDLGFLRDLHAYGRSMYAMFQPQGPINQGPPAVTITELSSNEVMPCPKETTSQKVKSSIVHDSTQVETTSQKVKGSTVHDNSQVAHAISDMGVVNTNESVNDDIISKKAISAGPSTKRALKRPQQDSLEEIKKHIRGKLGEQNKALKFAEDIGKTQEKNGPMARSPSRIVTGDELCGQRCPISLRARKETTGNGHLNENRTPQVGSISPKSTTSGVGYDNPQRYCFKKEPKVTQRITARSPTVRNSQRVANIRDNVNAKYERLVSSATSSPAEVLHAQESAYVSLESNNVESCQTASGTRRRSSLSPQRPPSRRPHLSPSSRRSISANANLHEKSSGPPRTLLTMQMQSKPDPNTASTIRQHLGTEIPNFSQQPVKRSITATYASDKIGSLKTQKNHGHPLQGRTLEKFIQERRCPSNSDGNYDSRLFKRKSL